MGMKHNYEEDEVILTEKSDNHLMYLILKGSVALYSNYGTSEEYLYGILSKGKTFGELGLLNHEPSVYTVVAISPVTAAVFSENELGAFIKGYPDYAMGVMRSIAKMNKVFRINLEMVMEENKDNAKYKALYEDAIKQSADVDKVDRDATARWRSTLKK